MRWTDRPEKTAYAKTTVLSDFNANTENPEIAQMFSNVQLTSTKVLKTFKELKRSINELVDQLSSNVSSQENLIMVLVHCQVLTEILTGLRVLHNRVLGCDYLQEIGRKHQFRSQLGALALAEKVDISINLSKLFNAQNGSARSESSSEADFVPNHLGGFPVSKSVQKARASTFVPLSPRSNKLSVEPLGRSAFINKFSAISQLYHRQLITGSEKNRLKNLVIQEDPQVHRIFELFAADGSIALLRARLHKTLRTP